MTYNLIYSAHTYNYYGEKVIVNIYKEGFTGAVSGLTLAKNGININYSENEQVLTKSADVNIINTFSFSSLDDLFRNYERQYKCTIVNDSGFQYFEGFLITDVIEQTLLKNSEVRLVFSDYLKRLKYIEPPNALNKLGERKKIIEIINDCLNATEIQKPIYINSKLFSKENTISNGYTLFEQNFVDTDLFWKNDKEKEKALDILNSLLFTFNSFLYEYDGAYYIERYDDIGDNTNSWTKFEYNTTTGTSVTNKFQSYNQQAGDFEYVGKSQNVSYNSGANEFILNLDSASYFSLVYNNFDEDVAEGKDTDFIDVLPDLRRWVYSTDTDTHSSTRIYKGNYPYNQIQYPIFIEVNADGTWNDDITYGYWYDDGGTTVYYPENSYYPARGVFTRFNITVPSDSNQTTTLNLRWKNYDRTGVDNVNLEWFRTNYLIKNHNTNHYLHFDTTDEKWKFVTSDDKRQMVNYVEYTKDERDDDGMFEANINIPLNNIEGSENLTGETSLVFSIGYNTIRFNDTTRITRNSVSGDIAVKATGQQQNNKITGRINEGFINTQTEEIKIYDIQDLNLKNGIYYYEAGIGTIDNYKRTTLWTDNGGSSYLPLTRQLLQSLYKYWNKNRIKLGGRILTSSMIKPLSIIFDDNLMRDGSKIPILLKSFKYDVSRCIFSINTDEYSEDTITLINS